MGRGLKATDRRVIPDFATNLLRGEDLTILSDGTATRTFCYTTDALTGYLQLLLSDHDGEAFNIGADAPEVSVRELAERMIRASGRPATVRYAESADRNYTTDNPQRRCPDLTKSRRLLGFDPRVGLDEGLERTLRYYRDNPGGSDAMRVCVVGAGYVGLVSGAGLASVGHSVICCDRRDEVVAAVRAGRSPIHEDGLGDLLAAGVAAGRLTATASVAEGVAGADVVLLAVGTPSTDGRIDLGQIRAAAAEVGTALRGRTDAPSIVVKSTVLPGTTDTVVRAEVEAASGLSHAAGGFGLGMNPEFLREGRAVPDFLRPDRIVLGADDERTLARLRDLYAPWAADKLETNCRTAEMTKYANNCLLALQISAVNELANAAGAASGIDFAAVIEGVSADRRWSPAGADGGGRTRPGILDYLKPGCGFGGSCFPKDLEAMRTFCGDHGVEPRVLQAVLDVNAGQPARVAAALGRRLGGLAGRRVLVLGTAFKPGTDDPATVCRPAGDRRAARRRGAGGGPRPGLARRGDAGVAGPRVHAGRGLGGDGRRE